MKRPIEPLIVERERRRGKLMTTQVMDTKLHTDETFRRLLAGDVARAVEGERQYAIIACVPQHLPGEGVADIVEIAVKCVRRLVRDGDTAGRINDHILVVGLPNTDPTEARVFAHRLQSDLELLSAHFRNTVWDAGFACLPADGSTGQELLDAAIQAARTRRRRFAG